MELIGGWYGTGLFEASNPRTAPKASEKGIIKLDFFSILSKLSSQVLGGGARGAAGVAGTEQCSGEHAELLSAIGNSR